MKKHVSTWMHLLPITLLIAVSACHNNRNADASHSLRFHADTARYYQLLMTDCAPAVAYAAADSCLKLPYIDADGNPQPPGTHPDSALTLKEALWFAHHALRQHLVTYNVQMDYEGCYRRMDSIERRHIPLVERHCMRALWVIKGQMKMSVNERDKGLEYLNRAMAIDTAGSYSSPHDEAYWLGVGGITYCGVDNSSERAEATMRKSIDISLRTGTITSQLSNVLSRVANFCLTRGEYQACIDLCRQADSINQVQKDARGHQRTNETLMETFASLGMYDEALRYGRIAAGTPAQYTTLLTNNGIVHCSMAGIYLTMQRYDSALVELQTADTCFRRTKNEFLQMQAQCQRANIYTYIPDSTALALPLLQQYEGRVPEPYLSFYNYYYGRACAKTGQWQRAVPYLKEGMERAIAISQLPMALDAGRLLLECYGQTEQSKALATLLPRYQEINDSVVSHNKIAQLAAANIGFQTEKKEQENRLLTAQVALKDSRLRTTALVGVILALLVVALTIWFVMRQRAYRLRQHLAQREKESAQRLLQEQEGQLRSLIASRQELNERNRRLFNQLSAIQAANDNSCQLDSVMESLQTALLTPDEIERFRQSFTALHPTALVRLRNACPEITRNEELFCMLVIVQQNTEEIARTLGIDRKSVTKIRYRLRTKLALPEGTDIDIWVQKLA